MNQLQTMNERDAKSSPATADMKLEVVVIPVSDVDRAKHFYGGLGWRLDADLQATNFISSSLRLLAPSVR